MATPPPNNTIQRHELEEILNRLDWVDEERRKTARKLTEMEQLVGNQTRELESRDQRIRDLEVRLLNQTTQLNRVSQIDTTLQQFKDELVALIEQYDQRRIQTAAESERLRRLEKEGQVREIAEIRKELPEIGRLRSDMELRQAEESRLAQLIGKVQNRLPAVENRIESWERDLSFLADNERQWAKNITTLEGSLLEVTRRLEPLQGRIDILSSNILKAESNIQDLTGLQVEVRQTVKQWVDQIQLGEYERNQRMENWMRAAEDNKKALEQFTKDWIGFSEQYREAQMALEALTEWQRQFEGQQREMGEVNRVEIGRMHTRWDGFLADYEKRWRNFQLEQEQRASDGQRRDRQLEEQIQEQLERIKELEAEKDTMWRVQAAQLDAVKNFPRIWLEEVEKARARDPNRRRQPALVPVEME